MKEGEEKQKTPEGQITSDVFKMGELSMFVFCWE